MKALAMYGKNGADIVPITLADFQQVGNGQPIAATGVLCHIETNGGEIVPLNPVIIQTRA